MPLKLHGFAASLLLAGAVMAQTVTPPSQSQSQIQIQNAWARATPGKAENGAAYLTIVSPVPDRLTELTTPVAKKAEVHTMTMEGGVMRMRPLADIDVPANQPVTLKPGGTHIMLMGLTRPLKPGESFPLTLSFDKSGKREIAVAIEKAGAMGPEGHSGADMPMQHRH
jgi:copper(I)-binding protein